MKRLHFGDPCIHCGQPHDQVGVGECPEAVGEAALVRCLKLTRKRMADAEQTYKLSMGILRKQADEFQAELNQLAAGLDTDKIALARTVLYVRGSFMHAGADRQSVIASAVDWFATEEGGYRGLRYEFFGTKDYDRWHGQRCDCEYGYGPRHGGIIFAVGLVQEMRKATLTQEQKSACIYYLLNIEAIEAAKAKETSNGRT